VNSGEIESRDPRSSTGSPYRMEIVLPLNVHWTISFHSQGVLVAGVRGVDGDCDRL
jgi:hypothetical protein